ncbi:mannitol dehydrogenase family protein [Muricoccus pecuniae]|uniref:Mannitol-1-phosphate/altronate dehydrogenase n=1 Tax=Muricoccus pecuniae TaxID=693023 RepID=A0A840YJA4_9PROT|nr:mannitol dehydrogenase family protein [Roseomonas pecuniae]MBB5694223.1 mannitol-1-phosphate/altronate dehydrogenase [Roseomonas pecuniae]
MEPVALNRGSLSRLRPPVRVPRYDPAGVRAGVVHLGLGAFHRAHMARYTHELMEVDPGALGWGTAGAGLLPADPRMQESLVPQDGLYTLVERDGVGETVSVIGSIAEVIHAGDSTAALLARIDDPAIRILSLTVSENGLCLNPATRQLDPEHPMIRADLAAPDRPRSAVGVIVEAYRRRMAAGGGPFTALTCDNIQNNGDVLREAVLALAGLRDAGLARWIAAHGAFPNSMVDRITPATRPDHVEHLDRRYGIRDRWPVFCESFTQWVIEDRFAAGRPEWERVGAQIVPDVVPYEMMKLRLLNGSHLAIAVLGRLMGHRFVHEVMADRRMRAYMAALMDRETGPTLAPVPGVDLAAYKRTLVERFANPAIEDTVERINTDAPINLLVMPIEAGLAIGGEVDFLALALAAWMRRLRGVDDKGAPIEIRHPLAPLLQEKAGEGGRDPMPLLSIETLFGGLGREERFVAPLRRWLASLYDIGAEGTLERAMRELAAG